MNACELMERVSAWADRMLSTRAVVEPLKDTELFTGRIKGLPSIASMERTESEVIEVMRIKLANYAQAQIANGKALPFSDIEAPEVKPEVKAVVRLSVLRKLLLARAGAWGTNRKNTPPKAIALFLADLDQLITRHALAMPSSQ
jgi:hypothetical protein